MTDEQAEDGLMLVTVSDSTTKITNYHWLLVIANSFASGFIKELDWDVFPGPEIKQVLEQVIPGPES